MAIVFMDGCGEGFQSVSDYHLKWTTLGTLNGAWNIGTSVRAGALGTRQIVGNVFVGPQFNYITVADLTTIYVEFWFSSSAASKQILTLCDSGTLAHFSLFAAGSGSNQNITAQDANGATVGSVYNSGLVGNWVHIGVKLVTGAAGNVTVTVDDVVIINAVAGDFLNGANNFVRNVGVWCETLGNTGTAYDDIVIQDSGGALLGSGVNVVALRPTLAGDSAQFTPSTGANWENVDETDPDDDTTYNASSTAGHLDLYNITNLPAYTGDVKAVMAVALLKKDSGGTRQSKLAVKTNSSVAYGSTVSLSNTYAVYSKLWETNPVTAVAWTQADANALQIGIEVV